MDPEKTTRITKPDDETEHLESDPASPAEPEEPEPTGLGARFRRLMDQAKQGKSRPAIQRHQLKQDRTRSFLVLAGSMVFMALLFFAMFSSPSASSRRASTSRRNTPNLGRGPGNGNAVDDGRSITPLLSADTSNSSSEPAGVTPEDIGNTARRSALSNASPSFGPPAPTSPRSAQRRSPRSAQDYALNQIDFPPGPQPAVAAATPVPPPKDKLSRASLVFVRTSTVSRDNPSPAARPEPAVLDRDPEFTALPAGTRLVARLETPVSTAVRAPVVAAIEYNYERDGEIVIPAGSKAFGEFDQANDRGFVGIRFHSIQMPDRSEVKIEGRSMSLEFQPLKGRVSGTNAGKRFLVRSLTGVGAIAASTVGFQGGLGVNDTISNNVLLRERVADNIGMAGDQQLTQLGYQRNIVVTVPGNTRFYIVLGRPTSNQASPGRTAPASSPGMQSVATSLPSVQELRELMELKGELTQMYQQQQQKALLQSASQEHQQ